MPKSKPKNMQKITINIGGEGLRHATHMGREIIIAPSVLLVEGVLNGSHGPLYYPWQEIENSIKLWDDQPLVVYHPEPGRTAKDPDVLDTHCIGRTYNSKADKPKARTECWFDVERTKNVDMRVYELLEDGKSIEASTGLYTENEDAEEGAVFNGREYKAIARNYHPDHFAVLPDQVGACSLADGGGILVNSIREGKPLDRLALASLMGLAGLRPPIFNEKSYQEITSDLYQLLQAKYGYCCYIEAVFDDWFVYCRGYDCQKEMYRLSYSASDKEVTIGDSPTEVYRDVRYLKANNEVLLTITNVKEIEMPKKTKKENVDHLIANGGYEESDRKQLETFSDEKLGKLVAKVTANTPEPIPPATPPTTPPTQPAPTTPPTTPQMTKDSPEPTVNKIKLEDIMTPEEKAVYNHGLAALNAERENLILTIKANPHNKFSEAWLRTQSPEFLKNLAASIPPPVRESMYVGAPSFNIAQVENGHGFDEKVQAEELKFDNPLARRAS